MCNHHEEKLLKKPRNYFLDRYLDKSLNIKLRNFTGRHLGASLFSFDFNEECMKELFEWSKTPMRFLIVQGPNKSGKSYFCSAIIKMVCDMLYKPIDIAYSYEKNTLTKIKLDTNDINDIGSSKSLKFLINTDLVILEDLGKAEFDNWKKESMFWIVHDRYNSKKPTIFTTDMSREDIFEKYGDKIGSRLFDCENIIINLKESLDSIKEKYNRQIIPV